MRFCLILFLLFFSITAKGGSVQLDTMPIVSLDSLGRIGVGTAEPRYNVDVVGDINFTKQLLINGDSGDSNSVLVSRGENISPVWVNNFKVGLWDDSTDVIMHLAKNVKIGKTLINLGDYQIPSQTYFNRWLKNSSTVSDLPSFNFTGGEFPNPLTGQSNNFVYNFGTNLNPGGGLEVSNMPGYGLGFEDRFYIDSLPYSEFHHLAVDKNGVQRRPLTSVYAFDGSFIETSHQLSRWNLHDKDNLKQVFSINTATEDWNYNGVGLRHIFNNSNYQPIWQNNGNGTPVPLIGFMNNKIQIGNPYDIVTLKLGQGLEFGNDGNFDFLGTGLGDGATNLSFGTEGKRYNTIWFKTNFDIVSRLTNTSNFQGWGIGLNNSGAFYLVDYFTGNTPFYLSGSMPENSFRMNLNGSLCLGCASATEKLQVEGNLKLNGSLILGDQNGISGQVLTSNGSNTIPSWKNVLSDRNEEFFVSYLGQVEFLISETISQPELNKIPIEVYRNGIKLKYATQVVEIRHFTYSGSTIYVYPSALNDEIEVVYFK